MPATDAERSTADRRVGSADREAGLTPSDQAMVDEGFLRGASVEDIMAMLFARAMPRPDIGKPAFLLVPGLARPAGRPDPAERLTGWPGARPPRRLRTLSAGALEGYEDRLAARTPFEAEGLTASAGARAGAVEALQGWVAARYAAYAALVSKEFDGLSPPVRAMFNPSPAGPYADSQSTAVEKYQAMRAAYYRAGWPFVKRDFLDQIKPATFFGTPVVGGVHAELKDLLAVVETDVSRRLTGTARPTFSGGAGLSIGGFYPRFQGGGTVLSNHAFGLAIDIDEKSNPQVKSKSSVAAFRRATGEDLGARAAGYSGPEDVRRNYAAVARISERLKAWLSTWIPKFDELQKRRALLRGDKQRKEELAAVDKQLKSDPDLSALATLIAEYRRPVVEGWRRAGILTIRVEVIESFVALGRKNLARWGGEYETTKDFMHLELLQLASPSSLARPGKSGRRQPVQGLSDLYRPDAHPVPVNGPQ